MSESIGIKIKRLREEKNLSIGELAALSSIAVSQLEMIESGEINPSVTTLIPISRALGTRLGTILDGTEQQGPVISHSATASPTVSRSANSHGKHNHFFSLAESKSDRNMEPYMIEVDYVAPGPDSLSHHEGEEFLYVLEGEVELRYGSHTYPLAQGDTIYFDSLVPHCLTTTAEGKKAKVLAVTYAPF